MTRLSLRALSSGLLVAGALACGHGSGEVVLGAAGPWASTYGLMDHQGIALAVDEINKSTLLDGRTLRVDTLDDGGDGATAAKVAQKFVADERVVAVVGHVTSGAMVAAAKVYDGHLPAIATTATSPDITGISPWVFRVIPSDSANGIQIARYCEKLGRRRAVVLYENDSYGRGLAAAFARNFGGEVVSNDPIGADGKGIEPFVSFIRAKNPDVVFVAGTDVSGAEIMRQARRAGLTMDFVGGDGWSTITEPMADGAYVAVPFVAADPRPEARRFVQAFRAKFGTDPDQTAAAAYDATWVLARAVARVGTNRRALRDYLASIPEADAVRGLTGTMRFGADGDPINHDVKMARFAKGSLVLAEAR